MRCLTPEAKEQLVSVLEEFIDGVVSEIEFLEKTKTKELLEVDEQLIAIRKQKIQLVKEIQKVIKENNTVCSL